MGEMSITLIISIITVVVSIIAFRNKDIKEKLSFNPYKITHNNEYHRIFTHALIHADLMHLLINIMVFISFGDAVEYYFKDVFAVKSELYYITLYLGAILFSSLYGLIKNKDNIYYSSVGASGAVSAVLYTAVLFQPINSIYFFGVVPIPGIIFAVIYLLYSYQMSKKSNDNIAHDAHFFGAVFGFIFPIILMPSLFINFVNIILSIF
jgi:membrane associated rhomboid family serine protease